MTTIDNASIVQQAEPNDDGQGAIVQGTVVEQQNSTEEVLVRYMQPINDGS